MAYADGTAISLDLRNDAGAGVEKKKNCHGMGAASALVPAVAAGSHLREVTKKPEVTVNPMGSSGGGTQDYCGSRF